MWRSFADGVGSVFDITDSTRTWRYRSRPSAWENLEQLLAKKYAQLEQKIF
jgi:hypothetical protein